jgi:hypothetical protein
MMIARKWKHRYRRRDVKKGMAWAGGSAAGGAIAAHHYLKRKKKEEKMRWGCVGVSHHKDVGRTIEEWLKNDWCLYSYTAAGNPGAISHYLLFMRSE